VHHVTLDTWSRLDSPIHRLDARAKIAAALAVLVSLALAQPVRPELLGGYFVLITSLALAARAPLPGLLARAGLVLPFALGVAALNLFSGDPGRALALLGKSYLSACMVLLLLATTSLHALLRGLEWFGAPRFFLMVAQFLYRYLFVLSEQAQHMAQARQCRAGGRSWPAAGGAVAVLFARSYDRAERIHRAMLARGFQGHFILLDPPAAGARELLFLTVLAAALAGLHLALWNP
jgi:cobalt/nickel transport system permease protein